MRFFAILYAMKQSYPDAWPQFLTATIANWKPLFKEDGYKDIIIDSLQHLVASSKINLYGFVIMSNHIHLIWQALPDYELKKLQTSFLKFTASKFLAKLESENRLWEYAVDYADRDHHFWKRDSLAIELFSPAAFHQKLNYIHYNPVRAGICSLPEDYHYSSAYFYEKGIDPFHMLSHYSG